jgi:hypothetical protein
MHAHAGATVLLDLRDVVGDVVDEPHLFGGDLREHAHHRGADRVRDRLPVAHAKFAAPAIAAR